MTAPDSHPGPGAALSSPVAHRLGPGSLPAHAQGWAAQASASIDGVCVEACPVHWSAPLLVWIPGRPQPKQRPRVGRSRVYTPSATLAYEARIVEACRTLRPPMLPSPQDSWGGFYVVHIVILTKRAKREATKSRAGWRVKSTSRGDVDNIAKSILDGLQRAGIIIDDRRVADLRICRGLLPVGCTDEGALVGVAWCRP